MNKISEETMLFKRSIEDKNVSKTILEVYDALKEKGYNPVDQLSGYLLSGDPTYITSHKDARTKLRVYDRQELMEELINSYLNLKKNKR
jgi:uncharacterized protein (UPF0297 family)